MSKHNYHATIRALGVAILMVELAIALSVLLILFTLENSLKVLSVIGIFDEKVGYELWVAWPVVGLAVLSIAWTQFVFFRKVRQLFNDPDVHIEAFGDSCDDEHEALMEMRVAMNRYSVFIMPVCIAIGMFISVPFLNILLAAALTALLAGVFLFLREKARILRAEKELLT
jgi:hypothetical protein